MILLLLFCMGCGPRAFIDLRVESTLEVPAQANRLELRVTNGDETRLLREDEFELERPFPTHIVFEPEANAPRLLLVSAAARFDEFVRAVGAVQFSWADDQTTEVTVVLEGQ
ncbi:MAG: hypothetical protein AAFP04_15410 [Myxococcota bacterium]